MDEISQMFVDAIELDHLTDEDINTILEMFGDKN